MSYSRTNIAFAGLEVGEQLFDGWVCVTPLLVPDCVFQVNREPGGSVTGGTTVPASEQPP